MIIRYEFVTGESVEVEVDATIGEVVIEIEKEQANRNRAETRRHCSLQELEEEGFVQFEDKNKNVEEEVLAELDSYRLGQAIQQLSPEQRELVKKVYIEGQTMSQIAKDEGVSKMAITNRMKRIHKKIKNF